MSYFSIDKTEKFDRWYKNQTAKIQLQIDGRLLRITNENHFGHTKQLDQYTKELKFNNGNRIYYTIVGTKILILMSAGNKNSQNKDIKQAKSMARSIHDEQD